MSSLEYGWNAGAYYYGKAPALSHGKLQGSGAFEWKAESFETTPLCRMCYLLLRNTDVSERVLQII